MDYRKLGLMGGIEIHQQLDTDHKLFCSCSARLSTENPVREVERKLRPVAGELGEVDIAALHEKLQGKSFDYSVYSEESCSVECDEEPPHEINQSALELGLKIALMLNCEIPDEIHVMRKTVIDGSNTSGFQRTAIIGLNGWVETSFGKVGITNLLLEEDSCQRLGGSKSEVKYGLDRLCMPMVEIGTTPDCHHPEQFRELSERIGMILKSTGKVKTGLGKIRQDVNVSIKGGARTEIKGVQSLSIIPKAVEEEIKRQQNLVKKGKNVPQEVRKCLPDGTSKFMRPIAGAARLYPETDIPPIMIDKTYLDELRLQLPELLDQKLDRYIEGYRINPEIAGQLVNSRWTGTFEYLAEFADPSLVAVTLTSTVKQLIKEGVPVDSLTQEDFRSTFEALKEGKITKDSIPDVLKFLSNNPGESISKAVSSLGIKTVSSSGLEKTVEEILKKNPKVLEASRPEQALMGLVMKELRGKAPGDQVMKAVAKALKSRKT